MRRRARRSKPNSFTISHRASFMLSFSLPFPTSYTLRQMHPVMESRPLSSMAPSSHARACPEGEWSLRLLANWKKSTLNLPVGIEWTFLAFCGEPVGGQSSSTVNELLSRARPQAQMPWSVEVRPSLHDGEDVNRAISTKGWTRSQGLLKPSERFRRSNPSDQQIALLGTRVRK
jgi:hypothetical protein